MVLGDALIVDDDTDGRIALAQILLEQGYTVREAENGRRALDMIAERVPALLVLDLEMPVMSGWELIDSLRRAGALPAITLVVLSAGASPPAGVTFMQKPCSVGDFLGAVRAAVLPPVH